MPTYNYQCEVCSNEFSAFQSMNAKPLNSCNDCGGQVQRKISGGTGLIFKGTGFYLTDYSKKNTDKNNSSESIKKLTKESKTTKKKEVKHE
jgi:putative FmdB family regulatory protein